MWPGRFPMAGRVGDAWCSASARLSGAHHGCTASAISDGGLERRRAGASGLGPMTAMRPTTAQHSGFPNGSREERAPDYMVCRTGSGRRLQYRSHGTTVLGALAAMLLAVTAQATDAAGYEAIPVTNVGRIAGVVRVSKPLPPLPPLEVFKNKQTCGEAVPDDSLVVTSDGAVQYAVVSLEGVTRGLAPEAESVTVIDNVGCRFVPHVASASVGQWLLFRNSDPLLHNADGRMNGKTVFNVALPKGREVRRPLVEAGLLAITCDVRHTWMKAYVFVADHPYHAVTDVSGTYEIRGIPTGSQTVRVWHERLGELRKEVSVEAGKVTTVDFDLRP